MTEPGGQGGNQDQPGVGHQGRVIEDHSETVGTMRYSRHKKCLLGLWQTSTSDIDILPAQEALLVDGHTPQTVNAASETVD